MKEEEEEEEEEKEKPFLTPSPVQKPVRHSTMSTRHSSTSCTKANVTCSLTSLTREQLVEVVRAHEQCEPSREFSFTSPRVLKKAKYTSTSYKTDNLLLLDDDLEGFLAKGKAEFGVVGANRGGGGGTTSFATFHQKDLTSYPSSTPSRCDLAEYHHSSSSSLLRQRPLSRSFRSFASGSTAAELDCLVSVATPPGLFRNTISMNSSITGRVCTRPMNPCPERFMKEDEDDEDNDDDDDNETSDDISLSDKSKYQFSC